MHGLNLTFGKLPLGKLDIWEVTTFISLILPEVNIFFNYPSGEGFRRRIFCHCHVNKFLIQQIERLRRDDLSKIFMAPINFIVYSNQQKQGLILVHYLLKTLFSRFIIAIFGFKANLFVFF